jgi:hypothetical protein
MPDVPVPIKQEPMTKEELELLKRQHRRSGRTFRETWLPALVSLVFVIALGLSLYIQPEPKELWIFTLSVSCLGLLLTLFSWLIDNALKRRRDRRDRFKEIIVADIEGRELRPTVFSDPAYCFRVAGVEFEVPVELYERWGVGDRVILERSCGSKTLLRIKWAYEDRLPPASPADRTRNSDREER